MRPLKKEELVAGTEYLCEFWRDTYFRRKWTETEDGTFGGIPYETYTAVYPLPSAVQRPTREELLDLNQAVFTCTNKEQEVEIINDFAEKFCEKEG